MNDEINYKNNPLHGLSLKNMLIEIVDHYGFEILFAYLRINCFDKNPDIASSVKFLKKTDWAREKVESFYLYQYKNLPRCSRDQFELSPRDRIVSEDEKPGEPAELSIEDAERLQEKRARRAAEFNRSGAHRNSGSGSRSRSESTSRTRSGAYGKRANASKPRKSKSDPVNPWASARPKSQRKD